MLTIRLVFGSVASATKAGSSEALSAAPTLGKVNICLAASLGAPFVLGMVPPPPLPHAARISSNVTKSSGTARKRPGCKYRIFMSFLLAPKGASALLVLQYIYIGPISEEETGAIQRHPMYP